VHVGIHLVFQRLIDGFTRALALPVPVSVNDRSARAAAHGPLADCTVVAGETDESVCTSLDAEGGNFVGERGGRSGRSGRLSWGLRRRITSLSRSMRIGGLHDEAGAMSHSLPNKKLVECAFHHDAVAGCPKRRHGQPCCYWPQRIEREAVSRCQPSCSGPAPSADAAPGRAHASLQTP
jgi:hypothetical protein